MNSLALLSALLLPATPAPTPKYESFYPAKVGTKWVYQDGDEEMILTVSAVERKPEELVVTVVQVLQDGKTTPYEKLTVSEKGLFRVEIRGVTFDAPLCVVRFPHKDGDKWGVNVPGPAPLRRQKGTATAGGPENVVVPAGSYKALRVDLTAKDSDGTPIQTTYWFAPGVGILTMTRDGRERVLKSFTPAE